MKKKISIVGITFIAFVSLFIYLFPWGPKCKPWRNVLGYYALCVDLNSVRNCAVLACKGGRTTQSLTNFHLLDANGSMFTFANNQTITIAQQNQLITAANQWANANKPSGYAIATIAFTPAIVTNHNSITYAAIEEKVMYQMCDGKLPN
jgi:hypothetical protein